MRKRLSILTALALAVSLTACGSESTADTADSGETVQETESEETGAEETEDVAETVEGVAGETYTGTVASISEDAITVATENADVVIALSSDTEFSYSMGDGMGGGGDVPDRPGEGGGEDQAPGGDSEEPGGEDQTPGGDSEEAGGEGGAPDGGDGDPGEGGGMDADEAPEGDTAPSETNGEVPSGDVGNGGPDGDLATLELPEGEDTIGGMNAGEDGGMQAGAGEDGNEGPADAGEGGGEGQTPGGDSGEPGGEGGAPDGAGGDPGAMGDGNGMETAALTWEDIAEGDEVTVVVGDDGTAATVTLSMGQSDGMGGGTEGVESYNAVNVYAESTTLEGVELTSEGTDENAVLVETAGITVTLDDVTIIRDSDDSTGGDNSSFYGVGAAALVTDGTLVIDDSTISSDAAGGAGVFAYGDGVAYVSDTAITTVQDTSGGIHVAGGGTLYAWDLTVETGGESSAAIRSDRGSGTMVVDGGTYTTNWTGSPAVYSTADITVHDATLTANMSEAICIEGLNTIRLFDCDLTGTMQDLETNDCIWTVILYQSMSGDSEVGNSTFEMLGGSLTSNSGGLFYTTNTESTFIISDVDITYSDTDDFLLKVTGNANQRGWGTSGANGAQCTFTAIDQELAGTVIWDSISELDFYLTDGSILTGSFADDETNAGDGGDGYANVYISEDSTWIVTGDSVVSGLYNAGTITDADGNTVTVADADGNVLVSGDSAFTITVDAYAADADLSGAGSADTWADFEVEEID